MPYKLTGSISEDARIIIINESDWSVESNTQETTGSFEISGLSEGAKTIIGRISNGYSAAYGGVSPESYGTLTNVALNKSATADNNTESANIAVDGDYSAPGWGSGHSAPGWWSVDLGQQYNIVRIDVYVRRSDEPLCYDDWCYDYRIQGSNNNLDWTTIVDENHTTEYMYSYTGLDINYRYFRIYYDDSQNWSNWFNLIEFEAYAYV